MSEKVDHRSCYGCTHKKALPLKHPCKKCHGLSMWKKLTDAQREKARKAEAALQKKIDATSAPAGEVSASMRHIAKNKREKGEE